MKKRSLKYEERFRKYLFSFDFKTHLEICKNINVENKNIPIGDTDRTIGRAKNPIGKNDTIGKAKGLNSSITSINKVKKMTNKKNKPIGIKSPIENKLTDRQADILKSLSGFYGSENFYKGFYNTIYTDGFKKFVEVCSCSWLYTDTAVVVNMKIKGEDFIVCNIKVDENKKAVVSLDDGNDNILYTQKYDYTDFPLNEYSFYIVKNELGSFTYLLKGEY